MLKIIYTSLFFLIFISSTFCQKSGYENLAWGSNVEEVRKKYSNIERTDASDSDFKNSLSYIEKYSTGSIESREFIFWKNKLVKVIVIYSIENITADGLMDSFTKKFGKRIDDSYTEKEINGITAKFYDFYWNDNGTRIILRAISSEITEAVLTLYISLKYSDESNDEKSKAIEF